MVERRLVIMGALVWAVVAFSVAMTGLAGSGTTGSLWSASLVAGASVAGPLAAAAASWALGGGRDRAAGLLLVVSAATPTYFAWALNLPALGVGAALLVVGGQVVRGTVRTSRSGMPRKSPGLQV